MSKNKKKQSKQLTKDVGKVLTELVKPDNPIVEKRIISNNDPDVIVNEDSQGNLVLTPEDKARLEKAKKLQSKAIQAKIDAKEALAKAQEALQALQGSEAIKAIKQDIEARLEAQEAIVKGVRDKFDTEKKAFEERVFGLKESLKTEIAKLQDIQAEYQGLTGITKKIKAAGKGKSKASNGNGKFETAPILIDDDGALKILVTHKETKSLFEYSLYPANGNIAREDWLKLRHGLTAQFEKETKEDNLTLRAYLSNLKTKIEAIKAIA